MSQHYRYPPPPPAATAIGAVTDGPDAFYHQRRRPAPARPPTITTNLLRAQGTGGPLSQTPVSGHSNYATPLPFSPATPVAFDARSVGVASPRAPNTTPMEPYNPRQWTARGNVSGSQMVFGRAANAAPTTREATGMEAAMPSPPPPYSPEFSSSLQHGTPRSSPMLDTSGFVASPLPAGQSSRSSPQVPMSPAFPPPPAASSRHRERSASGQRSFLNLSGLRGKPSTTTDSSVLPASTLSQTFDAQPPAARRAASAGHIGMSSAYSMPVAAESGRSSPENRWQPGMELPPPPPGPPPPGTRSQSLNRFLIASSSTSTQSGPSEGSERPRYRRAAVPSSSNLGPIPPTPAGWTEHEDDVQSVLAVRPLRIDTGTDRDRSSRRPVERESSAQGIRERRSRSRRAAKERSNEVMSPVSDDSRPNDLLLSTDSGAISRRREHMRTASDLPDQSSRPGSGHAANKPEPQPVHTTSASILTPPYTPAVGRSDEDDFNRKSGHLIARKASMERPISHLLHTPNQDAAMVAPLSPARPLSKASLRPSTKLDAFAAQAMERHRVFIESEAQAATDEERLELFANFMVHESRLRRDRYTSAYNAMAGDVVDLTRDMWRSYTKEGKRAITPSTSMSSFDHTVPSWASDSQPASAHGAIPSSASSMGDFAPPLDSSSPPDDTEDGPDRSDSRHWGEAFKPSLSPIPSMAVSTVPDEDSSRGRQPSRWWEGSKSGSGSVGRPDRIEKTNRETKYMGVNMAKLQEIDHPSPAYSRQTPTPGASTQPLTYGADEYPAEKTGWHESSEFDTPMATPAHIRERKPSTPGFTPLDVSRLVTLPPPYPRHHPALSNSHPLLHELRNEHRLLADHTELQKIKDAYLDTDFAQQQEQQAATKQRRASLRSSIQRQIADGSITYADAAHAESAFDTAEASRGSALARANFETFETCVSRPLNLLLSSRLEKAETCIATLRTELASRNEVSDPNHAQEEGDEEPERLEKLTLLKWLFEAREGLCKEMFELHGLRGEKYSEVILTPYRIQRAQGKIDEAVAFFTKDSADRLATFVKEASERYEELQAIMEANVSRGVEDQLSAFWDIAPSLLEVVQQVPATTLTMEFEVLIPESEYGENPGYAMYPLQYLYSLLSHAEKSAYQFIEGQVNLLCLLHEVRTAVVKAKKRVGGDAEVEEDEERLTRDLKEKVGEVEGQWKDALGGGIEACKAGLREWLEVCGGWEEGLGG